MPGTPLLQLSKLCSDPQLRRGMSNNLFEDLFNARHRCSVCRRPRPVINAASSGCEWPYFDINAAGAPVTNSNCRASCLIWALKSISGLARLDRPPWLSISHLLRQVEAQEVELRSCDLSVLEDILGNLNALGRSILLQQLQDTDAQLLLQQLKQWDGEEPPTLTPAAVRLKALLRKVKDDAPGQVVLTIHTSKCTSASSAATHELRLITLSGRTAATMEIRSDVTTLAALRAVVNDDAPVGVRVARDHNVYSEAGYRESYGNCGRQEWKDLPQIPRTVRLVSVDGALLDESDGKKLLCDLLPELSATDGIDVI